MGMYLHILLLVTFGVKAAAGIVNGTPDEDQELLYRVKRGGVVAFATNLMLDPGWAGGTDIRISNTLLFHYTITVPTGSHDLEAFVVTTIDGTDNIFSVCSLDVTFVGANLDVNVTDITFSQTTSGTLASYNSDSAKVDFGTLNNSGILSDPVESQLEVTFEVVVVNASTYTTGALYRVQASADLDGGMETFTDHVDFTAQDSSNLWSVVPPLFNINGPSVAVIGDVVNWTVTANLRDAVNKVRVQAWINGTATLPACYAYLANKGSNYKCVNPQDMSLMKTTSVARFEIPTVINTGFNDNNTISVDDDIVIAVLTKVPSFVDVFADLDLNIDVYLDDKLAWSTKEDILLITGSLPVSSGQAALQIGTIGGVTTVAIGSGIIFTMDVTTAPGSVTPYSFKVETDVGLNIASVTLMNTGDKLCMTDHIDATFSSTDGSSNMNQVLAVTDSVANINAVSGGNITAEQFRVEVVVCVPETAPVTIGSSLTLSVDVKYEDTKMVSDSIVYTVASVSDMSLAAGSVSLTNSNSPSGSISSTVTLTQTAELPQTTEWIDLTVNVPIVAGSALATLVGVTIFSAGSNFACLNQSLAEVGRTVVSHTQIAQATYAVGYILNTGTSLRSSFLVPNTTDNKLDFEITLQILDHFTNTQDSNITITTVLIGSSGLSTSCDGNVKVDISGTEKPDLVLFVTLDPFSDNKSSGDNVTFNVNIYHDINSTGHAKDVVVHCMTPYYIGFGQLISTQDVDLTVDVATPEHGIKFQISEIDFNDNVSFSFTAVLDPGRVMSPGSVDLQTVVPVDMTYRGPIRGDRTATGVLHSDVTVFEFTFDTEATFALGLGSGIIKDCCITASSWLGTNTPSETRLGTGRGWKPAIRGAPFCGEEFIQVDLGTPSMLTRVRVQSSVDNHADIPTAYMILYSDDGLNWRYMYDADNVTPKIFTIDVTSGSSVHDVYDLDLSPGLMTRNIRLVPQSSACLIGLRLELFGVLGSGPQAACTNNTVSRPLVDRSYIANPGTGTIFVCGPESIGGNIYCSRSDEAGDSWHAVADVVSNVIGTITNTTTVIGLSHDGSSHVISFDDGITWEVLLAEKLTSYQSEPGYLTAVVFPDDADMRSDTFDSIYSLYGTDGNNFSLTGCVDGIAVKIDGGSWQTKAWWGTQEASTMV